MAINLAKSVITYLQERPAQRFTAREIAEWFFASFPEECQAKKASSQSLVSDDELITQLIAEIGSQRPRLQRKYPELKTTESRPRKYYYSQLSDSAEIGIVEDGGVSSLVDLKDTRINEHALYPILSTYLWEEFGHYSKRIDEKRSSNKRGPNGNRWLYPDLVVMEDFGAEWTQEVRDCAKQYFDKRTRLWSFEVKLLINRSNVRECFFQAVSNSSWANFGYLVAYEIEGKDTLKELRMLSASHGIGFIQLDVEDPSSSYIEIPAKERIEIDWDVVNRLSAENKDFSEFVKVIKQFYQTGDVSKTDWDIPADSEN